MEFTEHLSRQENNIKSFLASSITTRTTALIEFKHGHSLFSKCSIKIQKKFKIACIKTHFVSVFLDTTKFADFR